MDVRFNEFTEKAASTKLAPEDMTSRGTLISLAIGLAISRTIPLPSSAVQEPDDFFNNSLQDTRRLISLFNENVIFDMWEAEQIVRAIWMVRYNAMYPRQYPMLAFEGQTFFDALMGVSNAMSPVLTAFANKYAFPIFILCNVAGEVLSKIH